MKQFFPLLLTLGVGQSAPSKSIGGGIPKINEDGEGVGEREDSEAVNSGKKRL